MFRRRRRTLALVLGAVAVVIVWAAYPGVRRTVAADLASSPKPTALDPSHFAPGACMAYPPTKGDRHTTVFLDAGHGGIDPGALGTTESGTTITEASLTLPMELDTMSLLRADGYRVVVSRTGDTTVLDLAPADTDGGVLSLTGVQADVAARDVCANDAKASALVGIYLDSGASPTNAGSLAMYDTARAFAAQNEELAALVENDVVASMDARGWQIPDDGTAPDSEEGSLSGDPSSDPLAAAAADYGHVMLLGPADPGFFSTPSDMPGTIVEPLFVTDPFEGSIADSHAGQEAVARGIAQAVEQFLAPPKAGSTTTTAAS